MEPTPQMLLIFLLTSLLHVTQAGIDFNLVPDDVQQVHDSVNATFNWNYTVTSGVLGNIYWYYYKDDGPNTATILYETAGGTIATVDSQYTGRAFKSSVYNGGLILEASYPQDTGWYEISISLNIGVFTDKRRLVVLAAATDSPGPEVGIGIGAISGIVISALVVLVVVIVIICCCIRKKQSSKEEQANASRPPKPSVIHSDKVRAPDVIVNPNNYDMADSVPAPFPEE